MALRAHARQARCAAPLRPPCWRAAPRALAHASAAPPGARGGQEPPASAGFSGGGWGVDVPGAAQPAQPARPAKRAPPAQPAAQPAGAPPPLGGRKAPRRARREATPFVNIQSPEGQFGLAMLQESLAAAAPQGAGPAGGTAAREAPGEQRPPTLGDVKAALAAGEPAGRRRKPYNLAAARQPPPAGAVEAEGIDEADDLGGVPSFQLTFSETGMVRGGLGRRGCRCVRRAAWRRQGQASPALAAAEWPCPAGSVCALQRRRASSAGPHSCTQPLPPAAAQDFVDFGDGAGPSSPSRGDEDGDDDAAALGLSGWEQFADASPGGAEDSGDEGNHGRRGSAVSVRWQRGTRACGWGSREAHVAVGGAPRAQGNGRWAPRAAPDPCCCAAAAMPAGPPLACAPLPCPRPRSAGARRSRRRWRC
jgi:hypothetical protein